MGFKDLRSFNIAMLAKQAWRLLTNPNTLLGSILAHKYYRTGTILTAKSSDRISFAFRSILAGRDLLERGLLWRIGDGRSVKCFKDRWLPRPNSFRPFSSPPSNQIYRVSEFIAEGRWDEQKLQEVFVEEEFSLIKSLPLPQEERSDELSWTLSQTGVYTVKSGYKLHRSMESPQPENSSGMNRKWLRHLWKLRIPRKVSVPVWRAWRDSLPVAANVRHRGLNVSIDCSFCGVVTETSDHLFMCCPQSIEVWQAILPSTGRTEEISSFKEWIEHTFTAESMAFHQIFAVTTWVLWYFRKKIRFEGENPNHNNMVEAINHHPSFFLQADHPPKPSDFHVEAPVQVGWVPPEVGWVKVNSDASVNPSTGRSGLVCVIWDEMGVFVAGKSRKQVFNHSVLLMEVKAIKLGLESAKEAGCRRVMVESDCLVAISLLNSNLAVVDQNYSKEIKEELDFYRGFSPWFEACSFSHIRRSGNVLAHAFAKCALDIESSMLFTEKPNWASESLYGVSEPFGV